VSMPGLTPEFARALVDSWQDDGEIDLWEGTLLGLSTVAPSFLKEPLLQVANPSQQLMNEVRSVTYATLATLWNAFMGGSGWALLSMINQDHDPLDPFLRPPSRTYRKGLPDISGDAVTASRTTFDLGDGLALITTSVVAFDPIDDGRVTALATGRGVFNIVT